MNHAIRELDRLYVIDPLCHIYNRSGFIRLANEMFEKSTRNGTNVMIAFIDMDGLKLINDNYGHKEGDFGIKLVGRAAKFITRGGELCVRAGGDEFYIVGIGDYDEEDCRVRKESFIRWITDASASSGKPYKVTASVGYSVCDNFPGIRLDEIMIKADEEMYNMKREHRMNSI